MHAFGCSLLAPVPRCKPSQRRHRGVRQRVAADQRVARGQRLVHNDGAGVGERRVQPPARDQPRAHHPGGPQHRRVAVPREDHVARRHVAGKQLPEPVRRRQQQEVRGRRRYRDVVLGDYLNESSRLVQISVEERQYLKLKYNFIV